MADIADRLKLFTVRNRMTLSASMVKSLDEAKQIVRNLPHSPEDLQSMQNQFKIETNGHLTHEYDYEKADFVPLDQ